MRRTFLRSSLQQRQPSLGVEAVRRSLYYSPGAGPRLHRTRRCARSESVPATRVAKGLYRPEDAEELSEGGHAGRPGDTAGPCAQVITRWRLTRQRSSHPDPTHILPGETVRTRTRDLFLLKIKIRRLWPARKEPHSTVRCWQRKGLGAANAIAIPPPSLDQLQFARALQLPPNFDPRRQDTHRLSSIAILLNARCRRRLRYLDPYNAPCLV
jgi:hypothetical protein